MLRAATQLLGGDGADLLADFWLWWRTELRSLLPSAALQLWRSLGRRFALDLDDQRLTLREFVGTEPVSRGEFDAAAGGAAAREAQDTSLLASPVLLRLRPSDVLRMTTRLPLAPRRHLRSMLAFELRRRTPFLPGQVGFDARIIAIDREARSMAVELFVVKLEPARRALAWARAAELRVGGLSVAAPDIGWGEIDFRRDPDLASPKRWLPSALTGLVAACGLLIVVLAAASIMRINDVAAHLGAEVAAARSDLQRFDLIKDDLIALRAQSSFLPEEKQRTDRAAVVNELAKVLPDGTWLSDIVLDGSSAELDGESDGAAGLIARLDSSPLFANAHFTAPLTNGLHDHTERFSIEVEVTGK